jgi:hypothetical protein
MLVKKQEKVRDGYVLNVANQNRDFIQLLDKGIVEGKIDVVVPISKNKLIK